MAYISGNFNTNNTYIKARLTDLEKSLNDFLNIDLGVLSAGDPKNAIDHIHELFVYLRHSYFTKR